MFGGVEVPPGPGLFMCGSPNRVILPSSIFSTGLLGRNPPGGGFGLAPGLDLKGALTDNFLWVIGLAGAKGGGATGGGGRKDGGGGDFTERKPAGSPALLLGFSLDAIVSYKISFALIGMFRFVEKQLFPLQ